VSCVNAKGSVVVGGKTSKVGQPPSNVANPSAMTPLSSPPPVQASTAILPFKTGDTLEYVGSYGIGGADVFQFKAAISVKDASETEAKRKETVRVAASYGNGSYDSIETFTRNTSWITAALTDGSGNVGQHYKLFPASLSSGKEWKVSYIDALPFDQELPTGTAKVEAIESIAVSAGEFKDCYKIHYSDSEQTQSDITIWIAPGVGIVRANVKMQVPLFNWPVVTLLPVSGHLELARRSNDASARL
jgi:hypothetical protein